MATLSLPVDICTYLMMRALGTLSRAVGSLATGVCGTVDGSIMTSVVITHRRLSLTFLAMDTMAF